MRITFLGTGDAFSSGGRLPTCILVETDGPRVLLDCGPAVLAALKARDLDPGGIDAILLTHLHGDHFGGVPFFLLDAILGSVRSRPLTIAGPPETEVRVRALGEMLFPGVWDREAGFPLTFVEMSPESAHDVLGLSVIPYPVDHSPAANPAALRIEHGGKVLAFTGDTSWTETLIPLARDADLLIAECYFFLPRGSGHLDYKTLSAKLPELAAKRVILTHMSPEMLAKTDEISLESAYDGKVVET